MAYINNEMGVIASALSTSTNADDSSTDNNSIYTTGTTMSDRNCTLDYDRRSNEPIHSGDVIQYYDPIYVTGNPQGLREATVLSVNPKDSMPLVLSNAEGIPRSCSLKRIKIMQDNVLVDHSNGLFRSMDKFKLRKSGTARLSDVIVQEGNRMSGILRKHIKSGLEKCKADGFALEDIVITKLASSNEAEDIVDVVDRSYEGGNTADTSASDLKLFYSQDENVLSDFSPQKPDPISRIYPHDSCEEAIELLQMYGTVVDVPGDGSCGYHATMLLLIKLDHIQKDMTVYQFRRGILQFMQSNMNKFVGSTQDGSDCAFQYRWGSTDGRSLRKKTPRSHTEIRERFITTEVMEGIWNRRTDYSKYVQKMHWMDAIYLLPVIVYMYKIPMLVLFDNRLRFGKRALQTYIYTFNETIPSVNLEVHDGIMEHICPTGAACLVFIYEQSHYMFFKYSEVHEESYS